MAVSSGDIPSLDVYIRDGFDVINYVEQENGLIHLASYSGQLQMLQHLVLRGNLI